MSLKRYEFKTKIIHTIYAPLALVHTFFLFWGNAHSFLEPSGTLHTAFFGSKIYGPIRVVKQCATAHRPIHISQPVPVRQARSTWRHHRHSSASTILPPPPARRANGRRRWRLCRRQPPTGARRPTAAPGNLARALSPPLFSYPTASADSTVSLLYCTLGAADSTAHATLIASCRLIRACSCGRRRRGGSATGMFPAPPSTVTRRWRFRAPGY
jgi:hypothetical protein